MKSPSRTGPVVLFAATVAVVALTSSTIAQTPGAEDRPGEAVPAAAATRLPSPLADAVQIIWIQGRVEVLRSGSTRWTQAATTPDNPERLYPGDMIKAGPNSSALLLLQDGTTKLVGAHGQARVQEPRGRRPGMFLLRGLFYFFHRSRPGDMDVDSPTMSAAVLGTEFQVEVAEDQTTTLTVIDGRVAMRLAPDAGEALELESGEAGVAAPGQPLRKTAVVDAANLLQWCLYYPAVAHPGAFRALEPTPIRESLLAYRSGHLPRALELYPEGRRPESVLDRLYLASLLLSVGGVEDAERLLTDIREATPDERRLLSALHRMIAAVQDRPDPPRPADFSALSPSEALAASYQFQSEHDLTSALDAARHAVSVAPDFGFGWIRVAELEFSFGRTARANAAVGRGLALVPENAQAIALEAFLLAAANRVREAQQRFEDAARLDGRLGNAWLGRGLCRIRLGDLEGGLQDLQSAATAEPRRAILRAYLGKGFEQADRLDLSRRELELARQLDPADPTPWLYSALLNRRANRINRAIGDLEQSTELNENRRLYRSRLLLDRDRAVRGSSLATLYADAGMQDVALHQAARSVNADYAEAAAHRFLSEAYAELRDERQVRLRYESPRLNEYLLANLLAPVGEGSLSPSVSALEYSRLLEQSRIGMIGEARYFSQGDWLANVVQYGVLENSSYTFEVTYNLLHGDRPNADLDQITAVARLKQQLGPQDSVYLEAIYYTADGGDLVPYYDPADANPGLRIQETQEPILIAGYHHEWRPGVHSIALAGYANDTLDVFNPSSETTLVAGPPANNVQRVTLDQTYRLRQDVFLAEAQQIFQTGPHLFLAGARIQTGRLDAESRFTGFDPTSSGPINNALVAYLPATHFVDADFTRASAYGYYHWQPWTVLRLIAGLSYDWLQYPLNVRFAPLAAGEDDKDQFSPKGGIVLTPLRDTTLRAAYSQSLGGVSFDQSFRLEPSQVAGFNQTFRSLAPDSATAALSGAEFETWGVALERRFPTRTYLTATAEWLESEARAQLGVVRLDIAFGRIPPVIAFDDQVQRDFRFEEQSFSVGIHQLLGDVWSVGVQYRPSFSSLATRVAGPDWALAANDPAAQTLEEAWLHEVRLQLRANLPSGLFGRVETRTYAQDNQAQASGLEDDRFWQLDLFAGYRFWNRRGEFTLGLLNVTDQDYRLNPINFFRQPFRDRTLMTSLRIAF